MAGLSLTKTVILGKNHPKVKQSPYLIFSQNLLNRLGIIDLFWKKLLKVLIYSDINNLELDRVWDNLCSFCLEIVVFYAKKAFLAFKIRNIVNPEHLNTKSSTIVKIP